MVVKAYKILFSYPLIIKSAGLAELVHNNKIIATCNRYYSPFPDNQGTLISKPYLFFVRERSLYAEQTFDLANNIRFRSI